MKKMIKFFALATVLFAFAVNASAQTASATGNAAAVIVTPITLTYDNQSLNFGNLTVNGGGAVTLTAAAATVPSTTGPALIGGITRTAARFIVGGNVSSTYTVTLPGSVNIISGANNMAISPFTHNATGTLSGATETFYVGGTLTVGGTQATGSYAGTFSVQVNYN